MSDDLAGSDPDLGRLTFSDRPPRAEPRSSTAPSTDTRPLAPASTSALTSGALELPS